MNESLGKSMQALNNYYKLSAFLGKKYSVEDKKAIANIIHNCDELKSGENNDEFCLQ